jgi:hypothetical protein
VSSWSPDSQPDDSFLPSGFIGTKDLREVIFPVRIIPFYIGYIQVCYFFLPTSRCFTPIEVEALSGPDEEKWYIRVPA